MPEQTTIRIVLADDHAAMRIGIATFLQAFDDLELVGEATNGAEAVRLCGETQPDVVLMDMRMPVMDGLEATRSIMEQWPATRIIAFTSFKERDLVYNVLQAGAIGYLMKDVSPEELAASIRMAASDKPVLGPEAARILIDSATSPRGIDYNLTEREIEVLTLLVDGLTNVEIAEALYVSRSTVKTHVSNILSKLGVSSRVEAVSLAIKQNLLGS